MIPIVFVDLDGVLVDLQKGYSQITGEKYKKMSHEDFVPILHSYLDNLTTKQIVNFWANLPKTQECDELWSLVKQNQPLILTASGNSAPACEGKKIWCSKNLNLDKNRVFCSKNSQDKQNYASPRSILIDDYKRNIKQFNAAGGHGIHHTHLEKTKSKFNQILKNLGFIQKV